jgi:hypothetical protein
MPRRKAIHKGDSLSKEAETLLESPPSDLSQAATLRRAARRFTSAADWYRRGNLGLLAKRCHEKAAECWEKVGESSLRRTSQGWAKAIPAYWECDE